MVVARRATQSTRTAQVRRLAEDEDAEAPEPRLAIVSLSSQRIEVFGPNGAVHSSRVSTGKPGNVTPTGVFSILQRRRYHRSNIYSNAPMPFMQRLTWSGIALHQGYVPGYPASHGCIRLPGKFAQTMWSVGRVGMRVIVSPRDVRPKSFSHAKLPRPHLTTTPHTAELVRLAAAGDGPPPSELHHRQTPYEAALERLQRAKADREATQKALKPAYALAEEKAAAARQASEALKASERILADAEEHLALEQFRMGTVQTEAAEAVVRESIRIAKAGAMSAREAHQKLIVTERLASEEAFDTARAARAARLAAEAATEALSAARQGVKPLSVFISRDTGEIYVRQGNRLLARQTVTIAAPEQPLGTHVYEAMAEAGAPDDLRWVAVSVPTSGGISRRELRKTGARPELSSAAEALDRIDITREVREIISERIWPGASIVVSDYGLGESTDRTETGFVILTR